MNRNEIKEKIKEQKEFLLDFLKNKDYLNFINIRKGARDSGRYKRTILNYIDNLSNGVLLQDYKIDWVKDLCKEYKEWKKSGLPFLENVVEVAIVKKISKGTLEYYFPTNLYSFAVSLDIMYDFRENRIKHKIKRLLNSSYSSQLERLKNHKNWSKSKMELLKKDFNKKLENLEEKIQKSNIKKSTIKNILGCESN